jgi:predicted deacylase
MDLHADSYDAVPYAIVDRPVSHSGAAKVQIAQQLAAMADATGVVVLQDYAERDYIRFGLDRSLAGACVNRLGVPALTLECGPRGALAPAAERQTAQTVLRVLAHLGCVADQAAVDQVHAGLWRRRSGPRVRYEGLLRPLVEPGVAYVHGAVLARVQALSGEVLEEVRAVNPGLLVAWANESWIRRGQSVATVASKEST